MTDAERPIVETKQGAVRGVARDGIDRFHAIPYAEPPVGPLRWLPPRPAATRSGPIDCGARGPISVQPPSRLSHVMGDLDMPQSEDCLTLAINRPSARGEKRPVLVWLHGGAWSSGGGDLPWYSGAPLAGTGDLVVVGVNYRLGALGFLRHPAVGPGNLGLLDQICALEWIRDNVAAFGGDPDNVTLCGQSAGAWSIAIHLAGERATGLFDRAILQSTPFGAAPQTAEQVDQVARRFFEELGLDAAQPELGARAREKSVAELLAAQRATAAWYAEAVPREGSPAIAFQPVADGDVLPTAASYPEAIARGAERMDTIVGFTRDELTAFGAPLAPRRDDKLFAIPTLEWARRAAGAGRNVHLYRFDWAGPDSGVGACHCIELPFVFGTRRAFDGALMLRGGDPAEIDTLSAAMGSAWAAFARSGDLTASELAAWPRLGSGGGDAMILDAACRTVEASGLA